MRRYWLPFLILLLLLAAPVWLLASQQALLAAAHWSFDTFTDLRLEIENPVIQLWEGKISADELHLVPQDISGPALFSVVNLEVTTTPSDLLTRNLKNTLISASQVLIYVSDNDGASDPEPGSWLQLTHWLPSQLYIGQIHLITASEQTWIFPLRDLQGRRLDSRTFHTRALADYEGEPLEVNLDIFSTRQDGRIQSMELKAGFFAPLSESRVTLEGILQGREEAFNYDFVAGADYRDIGDFMSGLDSATVLNGRLRVEARMVGDVRQFTLSDATMILDNMPAYGFEAAGEMHWERGGESRLQFVAAGEISDLKYLLDWIDLDVTALGRAKASVNISGTLDQPVVDKFVLVASSEGGLSVNVSGKLPKLGLDAGAATAAGAAENEIRVDAHAPSLRVLEQWVGDLPYDPGPWRASWVTHGNRNTIALQDIVLESGSEQTFATRVEGSVAEIANTASIGPGAVSGVDLRLTAASSDSAFLANMTGIDLPPDHAVNATAKIVGSGDELQLLNGNLELSSSDLTASIVNITGYYRPVQDATGFSDLAGDMSVAISDTGALSQYSDREIPILGPAELSGSLKQSGNRFSLESLSLRVMGEELGLTANGRIENLQEFTGVRLRSRIERLDIGHLLAFSLDSFDYEGELGELQGSFELADDDKAWNVSNLSLTNAKNKVVQPLDITAQGDIKDLTGFTTGDLAAELAIHDRALLQALTGLRARPVKASVTVATTPENVDIKASSHAGDTRIDTDIQVAYTPKGPSRLTARFSTPHLDLSDVGLQASQDVNDGYAPAANIEAGAKNRLEALLARSPRYPTDIQVLIDGISGRKTSIDSVDIHVTGKDNRYSLRRFNLVYDDAKAEIRGLIDLNPSPPSASIAGEALAIPLSTLSQDLGAPSDIRGTLTARGGVTASGLDVPSLLASLDGSLAIALEDTVIQGAAYDVLATDLLAWIYSGAARENSTHLDCTMARFDIRDGIATTDSLYIESARMLATGKGKFDLARQQMDLTISPRSRSRSFQIPSEIRLRGDMSNPRPTISPISAAADASAQALLLIPKLALRLFGAGGEQSQKGVLPCQAALD